MLFTDFSILIMLLLLIGLSGFFAASEVALISLPRHRAQQWITSPTPAGRALAWLIAHPAAMLGTILITITATNYIGESIAAFWVISRFGREHLWIAIVGMAALVILFAEILPILYASANPERVAGFVVLPVRLASLALYVPTWIISGLAGFVGGKEWPRGSLVTVEELRAIVRLESEHAPLEEEEKEMLHSIFEFADKIVKDVMVAKEKIIGVPASASLHQAAVTAVAHRVSRLPVFRDGADEVLGVIFVKDLFLHFKAGTASPLVTTAMRRPFKVPETKKVSELLEELRHREQMLAIVVDKQGQTAGLVTMEDLLEEIVGDIFDEYDLATPAIERRRDEIVVDGRMSLDEVGELLDCELPKGRYGTIAGLLLNRLGTVPREGERVDIEGFTLIAERMDGHRIARVRIIKQPKQNVNEVGRPTEHE